MYSKLQSQVKSRHQNSLKIDVLFLFLPGDVTSPESPVLQFPPVQDVVELASPSQDYNKRILQRI